MIKNNNNDNRNNNIKKYCLIFTDINYKKQKWRRIAWSVKKIPKTRIFITKNNRLLMQSKCNDCKNKKSRFMKEQEAKGLLSDLGTNTPFSKIPLLNVLF